MDLAKLVERVEGLTEPDRETDFWLTVMLDDGDDGATIYSEEELRADIAKVGIEGMHIRAPYTSSLDAAVAFTEALLPGYRWMRDIVGGMTFWKPQAHPTDSRQTGWEFAAHANAPTPALALVLAALKSHAAKETP